MLAALKMLGGMSNSDAASKPGTDHGVAQTMLMLNLVFQQRLASANYAGNRWVRLLVCDSEDGA